MNMLGVSVIFGSFAMIGWGLSDFLSKGIVGRIGVYRLVLYTEILGILPFTLFIFVGDAPWSANISGIKLAFLSGIVHVVTMFSFYSAVRLGKLSLVSPINASWGIVPIMISMLFLGEKLRFSDSILISIIVLGVIVISLHPGHDQKPKQNLALFLALISALGAGLNAIILKYVALNIGQISAVFYLRLFALILMSPLALLPSQRSQLMPRDINPRQWSLLIMIGMLNTIAFLAYVKGLTEGYISIVSPVAAASPVVTVVLAGILLKERIRIHQGIGVAMVLVSVILLSALS